MNKTSGINKNDGKQWKESPSKKKEIGHLVIKTEDVMQFIK